jgi:hypothetical protein
MSTSRNRLWSLPLVAILTGCAGSGPLLSQQTGIGTLKTSVSRLEFENQQLKSQLANLKAESRRIEDRLVQEEAANGELTARLDDARNLLSGRGLGPGSDSASGRTLPAGRSNRVPRKPPFARIPGQIDVGPPANVEDIPADPREGDLFGPQSRLERWNPWLPVASGASDPSSLR